MTEVAEAPHGRRVGRLPAVPSAPAGLFPDPPWHAPDAPSSRARVPHSILTTRPRRPRRRLSVPGTVLIVGGGFAGLYAARNLRSDPEVAVTLLDRRNFHLFQPMLYQVATGALAPGDIAQPLRSVPRGNATRRRSSARPSASTSKSARCRCPMAARSATTPSIVATGAHHTFFGHDDWARYAQGLKTLEDAIEVRRRILIAFEAAEREADPERRGEWLTFVLVGGGPTGVELAGSLGEIARTRSSATFARSIPRTPTSSWSKRWTASCRRSRLADPNRPGASSSASASMSARP